MPVLDLRPKPEEHVLVPMAHQSILAGRLVQLVVILTD